MKLGDITCQRRGETGCIIAVLEPDFPALGSSGDALISEVQVKEAARKTRDKAHVYIPVTHSRCVSVCLSRVLAFSESPEAERTQARGNHTPVHFRTRPWP